MLAGAFEHLSSELDDEAGLLGDGDEVQRGDEAVIGMLPADERLGCQWLALDTSLR